LVKGKGVIMFRTEKKKYIITMLLISVACVFLFAGCQSGGAEDLYLSKVSYVVCPVDGQDIDMYVVSSDCSVIHYMIKETENLEIKELFEGKLPEGGFSSERQQITEQDWEKLQSIVNETEFIYLPAEVSDPEQAADSGSSYIEIKTDMIKHLAGGHNAGFGRDKANKKYRSVVEVLDAALNK